MKRLQTKTEANCRSAGPRPTPGAWMLFWRNTQYYQDTTGPSRRACEDVAVTHQARYYQDTMGPSRRACVDFVLTEQTQACVDIVLTQQTQYYQDTTGPSRRACVDVDLTQKRLATGGHQLMQNCKDPHFPRDKQWNIDGSTQRCNVPHAGRKASVEHWKPSADSDMQ